MCVSVFINTVCLTISMILGLHVFMESKNDVRNRLFFAAAVCISLVYLFSILSLSADNPETMWTLYKIDSVFLFVFFHVLFLFIIHVSGLIRLKILFFLLVPFLLAFLIVMLRSGHFIEFGKYDGAWFITAEMHTPVFIMNVVFSLMYILLYVGVFIYSIIRAHTKRERRQFSIMLAALLVSVVGTDLLIILRHYFDFNIIIAPMPILLISFFVGCWYCMKRYSFLTLTPQHAARDVLQHIDESVILSGVDGVIISSNTRTDSLTGCSGAGEPVGRFIAEYGQLGDDIRRMIENKLSDFSARIHFVAADGYHVLMDSRFSTIRDRFGDILGVLIISKEVKGIRQLNRCFKITAREAEIIQCIVNGFSNAEISSALKITENTLKRHITNIYNKIGVNNKMRLLSVLKDFNIIPNLKSEKTVLLL